MTIRMLIDGLHEEEIRVVIAEDTQLLEFDIESSAKKLNKGNVYLAKVTRVEPSLQAAFVEYGSGRQGFLPFSEIHPDYYQIPVADKRALIQALAEEREAEQQKVEQEIEQAAENSASGANAGEDAEPVAEEIIPLIPEIIDNESELAELELPEAEPLKVEPANTVNEAIIAETPAELNVPESAFSDAQEEASENETAESAEGETANSDSNQRPQRKRTQARRYKIQEVIKKGQVVLIQVIKEERGNKGASVTTYLSIPGRYCVLMPNTTKGGGVSRKIADIKERKRLKEIVDGLEVSDGMSLILRTAGMGRTKAEITRDYSYLIRLWNKIREVTLSSKAPAMVYEEGSVIKRALRDQYNNDVSEVVVAGKSTHEFAVDFMNMIMPSHVKKIRLHEDPVPLFNYYEIEGQLSSMYEPVVVMPSGGYIVINSTEALISIDVNSGRATGERNVEDTATRTNIDAAHEIARQLRLRDLSGLIVIDFIDMLDSRHRRQVERALKDALRADRAKIQVGRISPFGLLEMSRQRLRSSLTEINMVECPTCKGSGIIRSPDSAMVQLARSIENELALAEDEGSDTTKVIITASPTLALYFLNNKRKHIAELEAQYSIDITLETAEMPPTSFRIQLEDVHGNRSRIISSDDREARLPQSRDGGKSGKRRDRKGRREQREQRVRERRTAQSPVNLTTEEMAQIAAEADAIVAQLGDDAHEEGNVTEIGGENNYRERGGRSRNNNRGRNNNRRGGGRERPAERNNSPAGDGSNIEEVVDNDDKPAREEDGQPGERSNRNRSGGRNRGGRGRPRNRRSGQNREGQPAEGQGQQGAEIKEFSAANNENYEVKRPYRSSASASAEAPAQAKPAATNQPDIFDTDDKGSKRGGWWRKIIE